MGKCAKYDPEVPMRMDRPSFVVGLGLLSTHHWWRGSSGLGIQQSFHTSTVDDSPDDDQMSTSAARDPRSQTAPSHLRNTQVSLPRVRLCRQPQRSGPRYAVCLIFRHHFWVQASRATVPSMAFAFATAMHITPALEESPLNQGSSVQRGDARGIQRR